MKVLPVVVVVVVLSSLLVGVLANEAARQRAKEIKRQCKEQSGATDADVKSLKEKDELTSPAAKKMMACVFTKNKIMQNNKFSKEGSMQVARDLMNGRPGSEAKLRIAEQIADNCAKEIGNKDVAAEEMAKLIFDCLKKQAREKLSTSMPSASKTSAKTSAKTSPKASPKESPKPSPVPSPKP